MGDQEKGEGGGFGVALGRESCTEKDREEERVWGRGEGLGGTEGLGGALGVARGGFGDRENGIGVLESGDGARGAVRGV